MNIIEIVTMRYWFYILLNLCKCGMFLLCQQVLLENSVVEALYRGVFEVIYCGYWLDQN